MGFKRGYDDTGSLVPDKHLGQEGASPKGGAGTYKVGGWYKRRREGQSSARQEDTGKPRAGVHGPT